jgi:aldehyde dehydrogenase (NAD+)
MDIKTLFEKQKQFYKSSQTLDVDYRITQLQNLRTCVSEYEKALCDALQSDFGKPEIETYVTEIVTVLHEIDFHIKNLNGWAAPKKVSEYLLNFPSRNRVYRDPFGVTLIIGAWNYPVHLVFMPLIGAISGGNTAIIKPSEMAPATSSLISKMISDSFDPEYITVVEGGIETNKELLEQPFDKIFFTGSTRVGKIVMEAAARHLTPVTLELGGKSPAIVHKDADLEVAARRIWWGKTVNAGQTCVAPDYLLIHETVKDEFISHSKKTLTHFFPDGFKGGENYTRIVNHSHFDRISGLLKDVNFLIEGDRNRDERIIEPSLVDGVDLNHVLMEEEIFGPVLPVLTYKTDDEALRILSEKRNPLSLYLFTNSSDFEKMIIKNVPFGGGCVNETIAHLGNPNLPFGGVGSSGMGSYHGKHSYLTFSRAKSVMNKPAWPDPDLRYPPYEGKLEWVKKLLN